MIEFKNCGYCNGVMFAKDHVCDLCGYKRCRACLKGVKWTIKPNSMRCPDCIVKRKEELAYYRARKLERQKSHE